MSTTAKRSFLTIDEYLAQEERSTVRHEYVDGQTFAMTGATVRHSLIVGNIYSALRAHLQGGPCRAYIIDVKVSVVKANSIYYPDVVVACGAFKGTDLFATNPVLIVEVLSPSTAVIDRREKLVAYRQIESIQEYLIVHQKKQMVRLHRKNDEQHWHILAPAVSGQVKLESIPSGSLGLSLDAIYEGIDWPRKEDGSGLVREHGQLDLESDLEFDPDSEEESDLDW
jgi:Uma2 family endonuclease